MMVDRLCISARFFSVIAVLTALVLTTQPTDALPQRQELEQAVNIIRALEKEMERQLEAVRKDTERARNYAKWSIS